MFTNNTYEGDKRYIMKDEMKKIKLDTITNLFEGNEIRSVWDSEKEDY